MNKVIIFPTDTVYGIGTPLFDDEGLKRIYDLKGRTFDKPIGLLVSDLLQVEKICITNEDFYKLSSIFWPGALTMILPVRHEYQKKIGLKTLGLRMPNHSLALRLIKENGPLRTTSCNFSGQEELNDYEKILDVFIKKVNDIYPNKEKILEVSSTVISLCGDLTILREGSITLAQIKEVLENDK